MIGIEKLEKWLREKSQRVDGNLHGRGAMEIVVRGEEAEKKLQERAEWRMDG